MQVKVQPTSLRPLYTIHNNHPHDHDPILSSRLHLVQNCSCELVRAAFSSHIASAYLAARLLALGGELVEWSLPITDNIVDSLGDAVRMLIKTEMSQKHGSG